MPPWLRMGIHKMSRIPFSRRETASSPPVITGGTGRLSQPPVALAPGFTGRGMGAALYGRLFDLLRQSKVHSVIGGIALPNDASVALQEKSGMRKVAHFPEVGFKFGRWIDVAYWQCTL